jgi:hypothetical protein
VKAIPRTVALIFVALGVSDCAMRDERLPLEEERIRLQAELGGRLRREPAVARLSSEAGDVLIAARSAFVGDLVREVTRRYLTHVELRLQPHVRVAKAGEVARSTFLGKLRAGVWTAELTLDELSGVLSAGSPRLSVAEEGRVAVDLPVQVERAEARVGVRLTWDAGTVASVVCRDFVLEERLSGRALPGRHWIHGVVTLGMEGGDIVARPDSPPARIHVAADLTPASWQRVRAALSSQDSLGRCGMALDTDQALHDLAERLRGGFDVTLPRLVHGAFRLPATVDRDVRVVGRDLRLLVTPRAARVTDELTWYAVDAQVGIGDGGAAAAPAATARPAPGGSPAAGHASPRPPPRRAPVRR